MPNNCSILTTNAPSGVAGRKGWTWLGTSSPPFNLKHAPGPYELEQVIKISVPGDVAHELPEPESLRCLFKMYITKPHP